MMLIRLKRRSLGDQLTYSIVICSATIAPNSNKFLEKIGTYKPLIDFWSNKYLFIDFDRFKFWLERGAEIHPSIYMLMNAYLAYFYWVFPDKIYQQILKKKLR